MNRVPSITEYGLLNRFVLNLFHPSDFQQVKIPYHGTSVIEAPATSIKNPYSNPINTSYWHLADRFYLLTPLKIAYVAAVTLTLSRIGAAYNGLATLYSYLRYRISTDETAWEKTKAYAYAFFVDSFCALAGAALIKAFVETSLYTLHFAGVSSIFGICHASKKSAPLHVAIFAVAAIAAATGLFIPQWPSMICQFLADSEHRVGMYLSLFYRKKLGLVGPQGGLLPFSPQDQLEYRKEGENIRFYGSNYDTLTKQAFETELELIETVQKCNNLLPHDKKIAFRYPLDGNSIAKRLESEFAKAVPTAQYSLATDDKRPIFVMIEKLRSLQLKIKYSTEIWGTALKLTYEDSYPVYFLKECLNSKAKGNGIPINRLKLNSTPSFLNEQDYKGYFDSCGMYFNPGPSSIPNSARADVPCAAQFQWTTLQIPSVDPSKNPRPETDLFNQFQYDVAVNKWKLENNQVDLKSLRELLSLTAASSYSEYKAVKNKYARAVHPDKNKGNPVAGELFTCFGAIIEALDKEYQS